MESFIKSFVTLFITVFFGVLAIYGAFRLAVNLVHSLGG